MSISDTFTRLVGGILDKFGIHYYTLRVMRVEKQNGDGTLDLSPVNQPPGSEWYAPIGGMSSVPIWGVSPGSKIKVAQGSIVIIGFENGFHEKRYALSSWGGGVCNQFILQADDLQLGGPATEQAVLGTTYRADQSAMLKAIQADALASATQLAAAGAGALDPIAKAAFAKLATLVATMASTIGTFEGNAAKHLSTVVKVK